MLNINVEIGTWYVMTGIVSASYRSGSHTTGIVAEASISRAALGLLHRAVESNVEASVT